MDSLYGRVGGEAAVNRIVDAMYSAVVADPALKPFFDGVDMPRQREKFRAFLITVLGGPAHRSGIELRAAHSRVVESGLEHRHFDAFVSHLESALTGAGIEAPLVHDILKGIEQTRDDVLGL